MRPEYLSRHPSLPPCRNSHTYRISCTPHPPLPSNLDYPLRGTFSPPTKISKGSSVIYRAHNWCGSPKVQLLHILEIPYWIETQAMKRSLRLRQANILKLGPQKIHCIFFRHVVRFKRTRDDLRYRYSPESLPVDIPFTFM